MVVYNFLKKEFKRFVKNESCYGLCLNRYRQWLKIFVLYFSNYFFNDINFMKYFYKNYCKELFPDKIALKNFEKETKDDLQNETYYKEKNIFMKTRYTFKHFENECKNKYKKQHMKHLGNIYLKKRKEK